MIAKVQLDEQQIHATVEKLVAQKLEELALPKVLCIDINDVKRITGIKNDKSLQIILSDPRILQHQFRLSENGHRRWNAQGFEEGFKEIMRDLRSIY